jgi:hypothetical protein
MEAIVQMKFAGSIYIMILIMLMSVVFVGCSEDDDIPVLARGLIQVENEEEFGCNAGCHAYVKIINTSADSVIAETKVTDIVYMPKYYEIKMKYHKAFTDYWAEYVIHCDFYNSDSDNTVDLQCTEKLDIRSYDRNINLDIR